MWRQLVLSPFFGTTSLSKVFWFYGLGVSCSYTLLGAILDPQSETARMGYAVGGLLIGISWCVMLWRCAFNSPYPFLGRFVRTTVVFVLLALPLVLYFAVRPR